MKRPWLLRHPWILPVGLVGVVSLSLFVGLYLLDYRRLAHPPNRSALEMLLHYDAETAQNTVGNLAQIVMAVLGIVITVVSIVVQMAATRYTPRIAELFFRDRSNLAMMGFFVTTCITAVWVSLSIDRDFVPQRSITVILCLVTASLLLMIPYFAYVFDFLDPTRFIRRIQRQGMQAAAGPGDLPARQRAVLQCVEQLSDVAVNAVSSRDKLIAGSAVDALKDLLLGYHGPAPGRGIKARSPHDWFELGPALQRNPDIVALAPDSVRELVERRTWLEWKVLRQLQGIFSAALSDMPDINYLVAIDTRYVGEAALSVGDDETLRLVIKFLNTYLRGTLNGGKVRTAYNVLNQYRLLAEQLLRYGRDELAIEVAGYFRYYAGVAHGLHLGFVTETVAYDLAQLCEVALLRESPAHDALLDGLLLLDQAADDAAQELTLRGVRKAQVKLATAYLQRGQVAQAQKIYVDMQDERPERMRSIRDELLSVESKDFWEIIDRGTNFDYLEPARKEQLKVFFGWFPQLDG